MVSNIFICIVKTIMTVKIILFQYGYMIILEFRQQQVKHYFPDVQSFTSILVYMIQSIYQRIQQQLGSNQKQHKLIRMSFLIKKIIRKIIGQYLNIYDNTNFEKGDLHLLSGHLNHNSINKILKEKNLPCAIAYSEYTNLSLILSIIQIMSKPIVLKMQSLRIVLVVQNSKAQCAKKEDFKQYQNSKQSIQILKQQIKSNRQQQSILSQQQQSGQAHKKEKPVSQKSYLKSIVNRLLMNMQIQIKRLEISIRYGNIDQTFRSFTQIDHNQYKISLSNFIAKNSLSLLEANIIKKIICLSKLSITMYKINNDVDPSTQQDRQYDRQQQKCITLAQILDLNMSLNIDYTRVTMICLLDRLIFGIQQNTIGWLLEKLGSIRKEKSSNNRSNQQKMQKGKQSRNSQLPLLQAIQVKVNLIEFSIFQGNQSIQKDQLSSIFVFSLKGFQFSKQKLSSSFQSRILPSNSFLNSKILIGTQSICLITNSRQTKELLVFFSVKMCEKQHKTSHSTIQAWSKSKRKQLLLEIVIEDCIKSINVEDFHVSVQINMQILERAQGLMKWLDKLQSYGIVPIQSSNNHYQKTGSPLKQNIILPTVTLTNIQLQAKISVEKGKHAEFILYLPDKLQILHTKIQNDRRKKQQIQILINKVLILINQHPMVVISDLKFSHSFELNDKTPQNQQLTLALNSFELNGQIIEIRKLIKIITDQNYKKMKDEVDRLQIGLETIMKKMKQNSDVREVGQLKLQTKTKTDKRSIYFRISSAKISIGSSQKQPIYLHLSPENMLKYTPIVILQLQSIKGLFFFNPFLTSKLKIGLILKSISVISPHDLSAGVILKNSVKIKLTNGYQITNKQSQTDIKMQSKREEQQKQKRQSNKMLIHNCHLSIIDPLHIDIQQQYLYLFSSIIKSMNEQNRDGSLFTTITNNTSQDIILQYDILSNLNIKQGKLQKKPSVGRQEKNSKSVELEDEEKNIFKQFTIKKQSRQEIYLFDLYIRFSIQGQISQPICLKLKQEQAQKSTTLQKRGSMNEQKIQFSSTDVIIDQTQKVDIQKESNQKSRDKNQGQKPSTQNRSINQVSQYKIEKGIVFPYHDQCKYIVEIQYKNGYLQLKIKYKYQLHIFQGLQAYDPIQMIEVRCIKHNKYEKYQKKQKKQREKLQIQNLNTMSLSWQLLQQDKIQHLTFLIYTNEPNQYKIHKLMTNSIKYRLFGLYPIKQYSDTNIIVDHYYIYEPLNEHGSSGFISERMDTTSHNYFLMPFLILKNNLCNHSISVNIINKKSLTNQQYHLKEQQFCIPIDRKFDYYMKQFMIKIKIEQEEKLNQDLESLKKPQFESQQHYFNTFFMIDESFQNIIELRSEVEKRYVRIRQSFIHKTKVLDIEDCLNIVNKTNYLLQVKLISASIGRTMGSYKKTGVSQANDTPLSIKSNSSNYFPLKIKKDDKLMVSYLFDNKKQNTIEVPVSKLYENNNNLLLSFNFCRGLYPQKASQQQYFQVLIKMEIKASSSNVEASYQSSNLQMQIIFSPFIVFTNLCSKERAILLHSTKLNSCYNLRNSQKSCSTNLLLPSNTNKDYNNKWVAIDTQKIYEDLLVNSRNWIMEGDNRCMQIRLFPLPSQQQKINRQSTPIYLNQLITHKIIQHQKSVYCLVKNLKQNRIQLFFSDHLYTNNTNLKYFIFNNSSQQYFLMNSSETEYAKYLLFPNKLQDEKDFSKNKHKQKDFKDKDKDNYKLISGSISQQNKQRVLTEKVSQKLSRQTFTQKQKQQNEHIYELKQKYDKSYGKVHIEGIDMQSSFHKINIMLNKQKHDLFFCDSQYRKLQPFSLKKLQKLKLKQQRFQIQNFTVLDIQAKPSITTLYQFQYPQLQFSTSSIILKLGFRSKNFTLVNQMKSLYFRVFENDKIDFLINDISVSIAAQQEQTNLNQPPTQNININSNSNIGSSNKKLQSYQVLRVPEQSYILFEGKFYDSKVLLLKNMYVKCKIIDLHINKQLVNLLAHLNKVIKFIGQKMSWQNNQKEQNKQKSQILKILKIAKENIVLIRSLCIHPINLCLTVQSLDFSNMITLPEFSLLNKVYRLNAATKQITTHYVTNIIAKFPKLSFIYQNLRSPITMIKSILEARNILIGNEKQEQNKRFAWSNCYIQLQRKYFSPNNCIPFEKRLLSIIGNTKKSEAQYEIINQILLEYAISKSDIPSKQVFICPIKNVVSSNLTKLSQMVNIPICYYLTNKNIRVVSQSLPSQSVSIKQIQSMKITKYNKNNAQILINFRRRGVCLKIVDEILVCYNLIRMMNSILI